MVKPWIEAGYDAILVDPQHAADTVIEGREFFGEPGKPGAKRWGNVRTLPFVIDAPETYAAIRAAMLTHNVVMVCGFPPCTDLAVSGAKHFVRKATDKKWEHYKGKHFQAQATRVVEQCHVIGQLTGAPWIVENPVSVLASIWRKPDHYFHPYEYTAYEREDNYTKKTSIWCGGGFVMPAPATLPADELGEPDDRIHKASPGPERENFRSATPMGFARAVFAANRRPALEVAA